MIILVVGLIKEIFIENIGLVVLGEIVLLNVINELKRDGVVDVSPSWKY